MRLRPSRRLARPLKVAGLAALALLATGTLDAAAGGTASVFGPEGPHCYMRRYDGDHLARHPAQEVTAIWLASAPASAGGIAKSRGEERTLAFGFSLEGDRYEAVATCRGERCDLEGDAGSFSLVPEGEGLRLIVGDHLSIEGTMDFSPDLARSPDDRVFKLYPASRRACG